MKLRSLAIAALAAMTLAACSKDSGEKIPGGGEEGAQATLKLAITMPQGNYVPGTRATQNATAAESKINTVTVFVFKANGDLPSEGDFFRLTDSDFGPGTSANGATRYEMTHTPLRTTSGIKRIYVAVNLPSALDVPVSNEAELLAKIATVDTDLLHFSGSNLTDLVMISLTEQMIYDTDTDQENEIDVEMERAMARVVTTWSGSKVNSSGVVQVEFVTGVNVNYTIRNYFVVQDAYRSFLAPNFASNGSVATLINNYSFADRGQVVNLYDPADYIAAKGGTETLAYCPVVVDPGSAARAALDGFYIGENATTRFTQLAQYGNTTYAYIQTTASLGSTAEYLGGNITYTTNHPIVGGTDDLYVLNVKSNPTVTGNSAYAGTYLCHEDTIDDITDFLQSEGYDEDDLKVYIYWQSYVYFPVFLNSSKTGLDAYNVYRNEFINIEITDIKASKDNGFGGYPGDEEDPTVPINPGDEDDNNPKPWVPEEPIDENEADITVNIVVNPWEYISNPTILE